MALRTQLKLLRPGITLNKVFWDLDLIGVLGLHVVDVVVAAVAKPLADIRQVGLQLFLKTFILLLDSVVLAVKSKDRFWHNLVVLSELLPLDQSFKLPYCKINVREESIFVFLRFYFKQGYEPFTFEIFSDMRENSNRLLR